MGGPNYRTVPEVRRNFPTGLPYIIGNEAAERFSYYGMKAILFVFMTQYIVNVSGQAATFSDGEAKVYLHTFVMAVYVTPFMGALCSDYFLGKYRTILGLSCVYCLGHLLLALDDTRTGLFWGLLLIAIGAGGIKPCVSAHVGDQFGQSNSHLLEKAFAWFYIAINAGAAISTLAVPYLLRTMGPHIAFGTPGVLMALATFVFWMGRRRFVHVPAGGRAFVKETLSAEGIKALLRLGGIILFVAMFWSLFDQTASSWVEQGEKMNREVFGYTIMSAQMQGWNPVLIIILVPFFAYVVYPFINKFFPLTPLRKISIGFFVTVIAFLIPAWIEYRIGLGDQPSIAWQALAYLVLTSAEVMVSITGLEFFYTQSPRKMKSLVMSFWLLSVAIGNGFTALVNKVILMGDGGSALSGAGYYLFFAGGMLLTALLFIPYAKGFEERRYTQDEA